MRVTGLALFAKNTTNLGFENFLKFNNTSTISQLVQGKRESMDMTAWVGVMIYVVDTSPARLSDITSPIIICPNDVSPLVSTSRGLLQLGS